jgi:hypothetical protein
MLLCQVQLGTSCTPAPCTQGLSSETKTQGSAAAQVMPHSAMCLAGLHICHMQCVGLGAAYPFQPSYFFAAAFSALSLAHSFLCCCQCSL